MRNTFRYASRKYWDQIARDIRPVYTAPTEAAAKERFVEFTAKCGGQYPAIIRAVPGLRRGDPPRHPALNAFAITFNGRITPTGN